MRKNHRTGPRHSPPGMPPEGFPPGYIPQTPEEAKFLGKEWCGLVGTPPPKPKNIQGRNEYFPNMPLPGIRRR
jgi:hypothetical protein